MGKRSRGSSVLVALSAILALACALTSCTESEPPEAGVGVNAGPDGRPASFAEPVRLSSQDGVLEVRISAHQGTVNLDTVAGPVSDFLIFGYDLIKGTSSDGSTSGDNVYPAPTLRVNPGERLIVHYDNDLQNLTITDFYNPAFTPVGGEVPLYPSPLDSAPLNLHTHGLHVSPSGNADNVLLDIPAGMGNTYTYDIPAGMPNGMYWYHSHRHTLTAQQTAAGLAGLLEIGRPDGNIPLVTEHDLPIRNMALQYNFVFDRVGAGRQLNNPNWSQWVSTLTPPEGTELADGTYRPLLAPVNFTETSQGAQYFTNWYQGPLSPQNHRGAAQFIPMNLQSFTSDTADVSADPSLPENQRDIQFTVNGQFQPELRLSPGQTEIWVVANISDLAYLRLQLTETATGNHPKFAIVGQDGNPYTTVGAPVDGDGTELVIPPGSRYAIAVTMPADGDLVLEMPPVEGAKPRTEPGILYHNNGTENPPAVLGQVTVDPAYISYEDGFFIFPTQTLIRATPAEGQGETVEFAQGQQLGAYTSFVDTAALTPDVTRQLLITGGFDNNLASTNDPKAFTYSFSGSTFPNIPLIQPRLNTVEEWQITNTNNDEHPMHIHVNDFQVMEVVSPIIGTTTGVQPWGLDNANVPAPTIDANEAAIEPASLTLRMDFLDYVGTFVIHCHRLNHEDNGLMATINVIPEVSTYAAAIAGTPAKPAAVNIYDGAGDRLLTSVVPFPTFDGAPSVAMSDVDGDMVLDLIAGTGPGVAPEVVVFSGAGGKFTEELARFAPFDSGFRGGVHVAGADIDGNALSDNIIVSSGPGIESQVVIFDSELPADVGTKPEIFSSFNPYPGSQAGVTIATGLVDIGSGRMSIVTAPGPGEAALIKTLRYDLFTPTALAQQNGAPAPGEGPGEPVVTSEFLAYPETYLDGVSLATGWVAGAEGGAMSVVTGQLGDQGTVRVWSSGSLLDGGPLMYTESPDHHAGQVMFTQIASFEPFTSGGVQVATTSNTVGADLLVSGMGPDGPVVQKLELARPDPEATTVSPTQIGTVPELPGGDAPVTLAGQ
ncbi:MAG: multicopper oxidase family protein [Mycobacterium sp.]